MTQPEWLNVKIDDHPLLESAEVTRLAYQGHLGAVETVCSCPPRSSN